MKVYILFYVVNEYNQPKKAFSALFWSAPTKEQCEESIKAKITDESFKELSEGKSINQNDCEYWIETFKK